MVTDLKSKVILHGGLGNQLFQWAFAHGINSCGRDVSLIFFQRKNNVPHASISLADFLPNCDHITFLDPVRPLPRTQQVLRDPTHRLNPFQLLPNYVLARTKDPFFMIEAAKASGFHYNYGYYQNWKLVEPVAEIVIPELFQALDCRVKSKLEKSLYGCEVIHIRQNDVKSSAHVTKMGVLSANYYRNLPDRSKIRRIVLTDDLMGARDVLDGLAVDDYFGPSDLNSYEALGVMSHSSKLFTANSTLSWWGGVLAQSQGSEVYIPHPFFRNFDPQPLMSFSYKGFLRMDSDFMIPSDFS